MASRKGGASLSLVPVAPRDQTPLLRIALRKWKKENVARAALLPQRGPATIFETQRG